MSLGEGCGSLAGIRQFLALPLEIVLFPMGSRGARVSADLLGFVVEFLPIHSPSVLIEKLLTSLL